MLPLQSFAGKKLISVIFQLPVQLDFNGILAVTRNVLLATTLALRSALSIALKVTQIWDYTATDGGCHIPKENTLSSHKYSLTLTIECHVPKECINSVVCAIEIVKKLAWSIVV